MGGRTKKFGEEPEGLEDYADELPDDQVVRRFVATHESHHRPPDRRSRRRRGAEGSDPQQG